MNKIIFWGLTLIILSSFFYLISATLAPFIIAFIFAYLLGPIINTSVDNFHIPRAFLTTSIFFIFISSFITGMVFLLPVLYKQIATFIVKIPIYKKNLQFGVNELLNKLDAIDPDIANKLTDSLQNIVNAAFSIVALAANNLWSYTLATINFFVIIALVPVVLFYFLRDWSKMVESINSVLPIHGKSKIREIFSDINSLLSAYIRGQLNICLIISLYYIISLTFIGLDLALLLGIIAGFLIIIPFIGALISLSLILTSCYFTYGAHIEMLYVFIVFAIGYISEGYFITPKIIGNRIGLHPLWIIFSVLAIGSLFGFIGIIFAIPIAGIVKLLLSHAIDYYKSSKIYND